MPDNIKQISDDFSAAGQPTVADLEQAVQIGFKSILNLRAADEANILPDEQQAAEALGLAYAQVALQPTVSNPELVETALDYLEALPAPVLIHCGAGGRADAIALIATAKAQGWTLEQLTQKAQEIGISLEQPHLQAFIQRFTFPNSSTQPKVTESAE